MVSCANNGWIDVSDVYVVWRVFAQGVVFCTCIKILVALIFRPHHSTTYIDAAYC